MLLPRPVRRRALARVRIDRAWPWAALIIGGWLAGMPAARALPDPNAPIDPAKRASVSTSNAVRPSATPIQGDGVIGGQTIRVSQIPLQPAAIGGERAAIQVTETRGKVVIEKETRRPAVRSSDRDPRHRASERPASIPRISGDRFQKILREYERGRVPAAALLQAEIGTGEQRVSIGDINRYANPRRALEAQGIPVTPAAGSEPPAADSAPVPIPAEKR